MKVQHSLVPAVTIILSVFFAVGVPPAALADNEPAGLVGRWGFDDGTGKDLSGNGNDAEFGGARIYSLGKGRACIQLLEDDDPMHIPASEDSVLAIPRGTICFWLNAGWNRTTILEYDNSAVQLNQYRGDYSLGQKVLRRRQVRN